MSNLYTIPEVRELLTHIAGELEDDATLHGAPWATYAADSIRACILHMYRRSSTRTRVKSVPVTPQVKAQIMSLHTTNPDLSLQEIADMVGVNMGRVSETLSGFR